MSEDDKPPGTDDTAEHTPDGGDAAADADPGAAEAPYPPPPPPPTRLSELDDNWNEPAGAATEPGTETDSSAATGAEARTAREGPVRDEPSPRSPPLTLSELDSDRPALPTPPMTLSELDGDGPAPRTPSMTLSELDGDGPAPPPQIAQSEPDGDGPMPPPQIAQSEPDGDGPVPPPQIAQSEPDGDGPVPPPPLTKPPDSARDPVASPPPPMKPSAGDDQPAGTRDGSGDSGGSGRGGTTGDDREPWLGLSPRGKRIMIGGCTGAVVLGVVVVLSVLNARDYYLECRTAKVAALKGSTFPWGKTELGGSKWRPIKLPPASVCTSATYATAAELEEAFVSVLLVEAAARVTSADAAQIDEAERQLEQALLLTRQLPAKRVDIERLQGDVEYWRAASEVNVALGRLEGAAARFEAAAEKKPRHKTDASQWAIYIRETAAELRKGPPQLRPDTQQGPDAPPPFAGTDTAPARAPELTPVRPTFTGPDRDAGVPAPTGVALPLAADAAPPPVDAALPTGGVLL